MLASIPQSTVHTRYVQSPFLALAFALALIRPETEEAYLFLLYLPIGVRGAVVAESQPVSSYGAGSPVRSLGGARAGICGMRLMHVLISRKSRGGGGGEDLGK